MEVLKDMFPDMGPDVLESVLAECNGNVERAIDCCLNMETIYQSTPSASPAPSLQHQQGGHQSQQHQQGNQQGNQQGQQGSLSQMELDELLAKELANASFAEYHPPRIPETHTVALDNIDPSVMAELINGVKSSMIPILLQQLKALEVPAVNEQIDAGKLGNISISLDQIRVADAKVPEENITIKVDGSVISISVKGVVASLEQFKWGYEKHSFPKVKDSGNADASMSEAEIEVKLRIGGDEFGNPSLAVTHCKVNIGKLDVKISGSFASFVYNTLLGVFKKTIKTTLETNFEEMIINSVNEGGSMNLF